MRYTTILSGLAAIAALAMTACSKDMPAQQEREIGFTASMVNMEDSIMPETKTINAEGSSLELVISESAYPEAYETKAIRNTKVNDIESFRVTCYNTSDSKYNFRYETYLYKQSKWAATKYYFHGNPKENLTFYAFTHIQGIIEGVDRSTTVSYPPAGNVYVTYTVPTELHKQFDYIAAYYEASGVYADSKINVPLNFHHLMTGINFVDNVKTAGGQIHRIKLVGVNAQGTCYLSGTTWTDLPTPTTYTLQKAEDASYTTAVNEIDLLLMPQTFSAESTAYIEIIYNLKKGGLLESARFPLANTTWASGKVVTYTISLTK